MIRTNSHTLARGFLPVLVLVTTFMVWGCSKTPVAPESGGDENMQLTMDLQPALDRGFSVTRVHVTISRDAFTAEQDLEIAGSQASGTFESLEAGSYAVDVEIFDGDTLIASGSGSGEVIAGQVTVVEIEVSFVGDLRIVVNWGSPTDCYVLNGNFDQSETFWANENSGPGVGSAFEEIVDIDGRTNVLHLDSRAGGNYYLFRTQTISFGECGGILDRTLVWQWKLATIESSYGLAAVSAELYDDQGVRLGVVFVRRHTGQFGPYTCESVEHDFEVDNPGQVITCRSQTGSSFDWSWDSISFTQDLFDNMYPTVLDPSLVHYLKIRIMSYNNAGSGVNAYFDDLQIDSR